MTQKESKSGQIQNEFVAKLQQCMKAFDEADKMYDEIEDFIRNKMPEETSKYDSEQQDYLHILENYQLSDKQLISVGRKLEENRNDRKQWHNIFNISKVWDEHKNKVFNRNSRVFLYENIGKVIKNLDNDWKFRVLSEEQVKTLLSCEKEHLANRPGRKSSFSEETIKEVIRLYKEKMKIKDIAKKFDINVSTCYSLIKRNINRLG